MPAREKFRVTNPDAPKSKLLEAEPKDIHIADAAFINEQVGAEVLTPKQVMFAKVLLMAAQAARRVEGGGRQAKATTKPAAKPKATGTGRKPAAKPAATKGTAKGRAKAAAGARGSQAATSAEPVAEQPSGDAPF